MGKYTYKVPYGTIEIKENEFANSEYDEIILPDTIETIGINAFINSKIKTIVIPKSVKLIDKKAFYNCEYLEYINFPKEGEVDKIRFAFNALHYCSRLKYLYIPEYLQIFTWKDEEYSGFNVNITTGFNYIEKIICKNINIAIDACKDSYVEINSFDIPELWEPYMNKYEQLYYMQAEYVSKTITFQYPKNDVIFDPKVVEQYIKETNNNKGIKLVLPEGMKILPDKAFYGLIGGDKVTHIVIPNSIEQVGANMFHSNKVNYLYFMDIPAHVVRKLSLLDLRLYASNLYYKDNWIKNQILINEFNK